MSTWSYFNRPTNMAFHDLTTTKRPPKNLRSLLGLSLKFIPNPRYNVPWSQYQKITLTRFERDIQVKTFMADKIDGDDNDTPDNKAYNPRMYVRTKWIPPSIFPFPKQLPRRITEFRKDLRSIVSKRKCRSNLLPHQRSALRYLRNQEDFIVAQCDKNLGPAIIERDEYIKLAYRDHLNDRSTYTFLSPAESEQAGQKVERLLAKWMKKYRKSLTTNERRFLEHHQENCDETFATFYMTMKVHKTPLKTRPIVSCSGSLLHSLGVWVDSKLQIAAKKQRSYFKSSFDLKKILEPLEIPKNAYLFTADAEAMYTNILTDRALNFIGKYLREKLFPDIPVEALMAALRLVMKNNIFTFGDTTWLQTQGTAMGTPPAPPWATLYYALCEEEFLATFKNYLFLYKRFIDDVLGIWLRTADNEPAWEAFKSAMNDSRFGLKWIVSEPSQSVDFMDLTISVKACRIQTTLYEKPSNLHLYIPPHSCHPPGLLPGVVHGMVFRIHTLCTDPDDQRAKTSRFFLQLQRRGYQPSILRPLFLQAVKRAKAYDGPSNDNGKRTKLRSSIFFHLRYHPHNPPSSEIQKIWRTRISEPPNSMPLANVRNYAGTRIGIDRMIVAYNRPPNLGNILSYRVLKDNTGPPVSSFRE